jgi:hypothetical protein
LGVLAICGCGIVPIIAAILFPVFAQARFAAQKTATISHSKQSALGVIMYSVDFNDRLPPAETWMDATFPYTKNKEAYKSILAAGDDPNKFGLAFRKDLGRKKIIDFDDPERWAMIFDSTLTKWNASSNLETLPSPGRYQGVNIIAFLDGHAKATKDENLRQKGLDGKPAIR